MCIHYNSFSFKGKSTADFPFYVAVLENDGINKPKRKDKIFTTDNISGGIVKSSTSYELVEKTYKLLLKDVSISQLNEFLLWLEGSGKLIASDNPDRYYEVLTVSAIRSRLGEVDEYEIDVTFTCNPFSYNNNTDLRTYTKNSTIENVTGVIMYPKITLYGNTQNQTSLTIGRQTVRFKNLNEKLIIECKQGKQNVYDKNGHLLNSVMLGSFFEIHSGINGIVLGQGITKVEIECRWGEFV